MEKVKLRIATKEDYPVYLKYLMDEDGVYHWFYYDENVVTDEDEGSSEILESYGIDQETWDEWMEFKKNWFFQSFDYIQQHRYYIITIGKRAVGYLEFSYSGTGSWKLMNCGLDVEQFPRREEIIAEAIKIKLPRVRRIYAMPCSKTATEIFEKIGFQDDGCALEYVL